MKSCEKSAAWEAAREMRELLRAKLEEEEADDLVSKLAKCGEPLGLVCVDCGCQISSETRCKKKWCPVCARSISAKRVARFANCIAAMRQPLFLTLTCQNYSSLTPDPIRAMRRAFGKLRRLRWWKRCVRGGVAAMEITNRGKGWHPHIHAVLDAHWLSVTTMAPSPRDAIEVRRAKQKASAREVGEQWKLCIDRPASVKVSRVYRDPNNPRETIGVELLKYAVKGSDLVECEEPIAPLIRLLDTTRLITTFGTCFRLGKIEGEEEKQGCGCPECGAVGSITVEVFEVGFKR